MRQQESTTIEETTSPAATCADVLLPVPFETFTYAVSPAQAESICVGSRVLVDFGKAKQYAGLVLRLHHNAPQGLQLKPVLQVLDSRPAVLPDQLKFWRWMADYYMSPLGDVYKAAMPGLLKKDDTPHRERRKSSASSTDIAALLPDADMQLTPLTPPQQDALHEIFRSWEAHDITLLHGVTSSGKTEIYTHLIRHFIEQGRQVLYLLPEIALTTQITDRLRRVFGSRMAVYHSKFSDRQRAEVYRDLLSDTPPDLILGVRSSVFLPFQRLGLVIVDEEQETSYKQQEPAPRYHARNAALMLARQLHAKALLGTATPSLETYAHAQSGLYGLVSLTTRFAGMELPEVEVVDIRRLRFQKRMKGSFSPRLVEAVQQALERNEQVILFQNRRGFSSFVQCARCGWVPHCHHCDVSLTYHKRNAQLICHYCGSTYALPRECPECKSTEFTSIGSGTERIEEQVARLFPSARLCRMDLDTTRTRTAYERLINQFSAGHHDILIGTQMVTKGLDFDRVSVVGILDADTMLNQPDFRATERTFQMLSQVAGRAGRKGHRGTVILQTRSASAPVIEQVKANDYAAMYATLIRERQLFHYPPFSRLIEIHLRHRDRDVLLHLAEQMGQQLRAVFGESVLGPTRPVVGRVASLHIQKILLKLDTHLPLGQVRQALLSIRDMLLASPSAHGLYIYFDVDPA